MVILQFLVVAAAFAVIDAIWLKTMNPFYRGQIGELLADRPHLGYAVVSYVIYIAGIVFFALRPTLDGGNWLSRLARLPQKLSPAEPRSVETTSCGWSGSVRRGQRAR